MKLSLDELIPGKYYICYTNTTTVKFIFRYKSHNDQTVYSYDERIEEDFYGFHFIKREEAFSNRGWFESCGFCYEIPFKDIVQHYPEKHPDRVNYFRRRKLDYLLSK